MSIYTSSAAWSTNNSLLIVCCGGEKKQTKKKHKLNFDSRKALRDNFISKTLHRRWSVNLIAGYKRSSSLHFGEHAAFFFFFFYYTLFKKQDFSLFALKGIKLIKLSPKKFSISFNSPVFKNYFFAVIVQDVEANDDIVPWSSPPILNLWNAQPALTTLAASLPVPSARENFTSRRLERRLWSLQGALCWQHIGLSKASVLTDAFVCVCVRTVHDETGTVWPLWLCWERWMSGWIIDRERMERSRVEKWSIPRLLTETRANYPMFRRGKSFLLCFMLFAFHHVSLQSAFTSEYHHCNRKTLHLLLRCIVHVYTEMVIPAEIPSPADQERHITITLAQPQRSQVTEATLFTVSSFPAARFPNIAQQRSSHVHFSIRIPNLSN